MIGILVAVVAIVGIKFVGISIVDPVREKDFEGGYWVGFIAACAAFMINSVL